MEFIMILDFSQDLFYMIFEVTDIGSVILKHFSNREPDPDLNARPDFRNIVNIHVSGEDQNDHHFFKHTASSGDRTLRYVSHKYYENAQGNKLEFLLKDERMQVTVHYQFYRGVAAVRSWCEIINVSDETLGLEYVSSFAYTGLNSGKLSEKDNIRVYIPHNGCVAEVNWKEYSLSELGINDLGGATSKRISIANTGTWSTKEHLPMGAVLNTETETAYLWQIENNGSWNWEISGAGKMLYVKLSGPSENENHWYKELSPGEGFESVTACVAVGDSFDASLAELTAYRRRICKANPADASLPVIFNDYMNCLGAKPTEENEPPIIDLAKEAGADHYCMDAGWYADGSWWDSVGEWMPSSVRFPNGLKRIFDYIKEKEMVPGIWLEPEVMGVNCPLAKVWPDECFFMRHGKRVVDHGRYQLDFRNAFVRDHLAKVVDRLVNDYGIGYIKLDYNIEGGIGTEQASDSVGDGLLEHNRAYFEWLSDIQCRYPQLIIENCASGGMRMDYKMLSLTSLQSTSDQTDYRKNARIAAAASTAVLPEQGAVWSYPLGTSEKNAVIMNMVNAMLGRIHLSGKIFDWSEEQMALVKEAVSVYKSYRHEIPLSIPFYPLGIPAPEDEVFCAAHRTPTCTRLAVWRMESPSESFFVPIDTDMTSAKIIYPSCGTASVSICDGGITVSLPERNSALLIEIK